VSQKNIPDIFDCNLKTNYQILINFGTENQPRSVAARMCGQNGFFCKYPPCITYNTVV